jgi:hypothetical protein
MVFGEGGEYEREVLTFLLCYSNIEHESSIPNEFVPLDRCSHSDVSITGYRSSIDPHDLADTTNANRAALGDRLRKR